jgi:hypothetical protein
MDKSTLLYKQTNKQGDKSTLLYKEKTRVLQPLAKKIESNR